MNSILNCKDLELKLCKYAEQNWSWLGLAIQPLDEGPGPAQHLKNLKMMAFIFRKKLVGRACIDLLWAMKIDG